MFCPRCGNESDTSVRYCSKCGNDLSALTGAGQGGATTPIAAQPPQESETELVREALKEEYDLEKELGRGGMAVVYKARDKQLEREVAIKVLPFSLSFDAEFVERFQREARTAGKLEHPNIIPIYRVGKSGRVIYFVMKFIRGKSLSDVIEKRGALPVGETKRVLIEASRALGYAHKHGIVHRDIKPDNIMFDELGQAIVTDFGIAKAQSGAKLTGTGMSIGTPHYMSPEQARAQNLDGRSDVYSLGVVAYQCLTGHVPFDGEDSFSIGYKHIMEELPVPELASADQRELFAIIQRMMAKKPDDRFQSAEEVVQSLEGAAAGGGQDINTMRTLAIEPLKASAKAPPPMASAPTTPLPRASASMGKPKEPSAPPPARTSEPAPKPSFKPKEVTEKKSKVPVAIAAVLGLAAVGMGGYLAYDRFVAAPAAAAQDSTPAQLALGTDSAARADSGKAEPPDTAKAAQPEPPTSRTPAATSRTPAAAPPSRTPAATPPSRTPAATPPSRTPATPSPTPPAAAPAGAQGTLSLTGVPNGATVRIGGQTQRGTRIKLAPGEHQVEITAQGFETYSNRVTIAANQTRSVAVAMRATGAPAPAPGAPPTAAAPGAPTGPAAACAAPTVSLANRNRQCYDARPNPRTSPVLPVPASCAGNVTAAFILVQVSASGEVVGQPTANRRSNCADFNALAVAQVLDMTFTPATKGGQPVAAWYIVQMRPAPR